MFLRRFISLLGTAALALVLVACGDDTGASDGRPSVVVTTSILGDVVDSMVGDLADVTTIMPAGTSPHDFQPSAQQIDAMTSADALITNGGGFEEGLADTIEAAEGDGTPTYAAIAGVSTGGDPHFFTDPSRMVTAARGMAAFLSEAVPALDVDEFHARVDDYVSELERLDADVEDILAAVPAERRVLVTDHEVFGYFAERYDFEIIGTVIPASSTSEGASAGDIAALADAVEEAGVPAIFTETSSSSGLAETLASEVGGEVEVVELFTESLGIEGSAGETYPEMIRTNARRIADALT